MYIRTYFYSDFYLESRAETLKREKDDGYSEQHVAGNLLLQYFQEEKVLFVAFSLLGRCHQVFQRRSLFSFFFPFHEICAEP